MRALVLSGGGVWGAWQVGALSSILAESLDVRLQGLLKYDVVAGVSVGALNAILLATEPQNLFYGVAKLKTLWFDEIQGNQSVYQKRMFGLLSAYFRKSLFSTKPLHDLLQRVVKPSVCSDESYRLYLGVWDVENDLYREVCNQEEVDKDLLLFALASASFPLLFPPVSIQGKLFADGGVRNHVPHLWLKDCLPSEIDLILTKPSRQVSRPAKKARNLLDVVSQVVEATTSEVFYDDLAAYVEYQRAHPDVKIRVFAPDTYLSQDPFQFCKDAIRRLYEEGRQAKAITLEAFLSSFNK